MSDNYSDNDSLKLYEEERNVQLTKKHESSAVNEPSIKVLQLVSIFENEESETKFNCKYQTFHDTHVHSNLALSQRRPKTGTATSAAAVHGEEVEKPVRAADEANEADEAEVSSTDGSERSDLAEGGAAVPSGGNSSTTAATYGTSTVSVTDRSRSGWMGQPDRNLLFVIHPWCMLHKSGADRQSEFPPPGFLERLKAKLMALHRQSDEQQQQHRNGSAVVRRRRHTHQSIKCWFQYTATAFGGGDGGPSSAMSTAAGHANGQRNEPAAVVDFLSVWRRYANVTADRG
ncbi:Uncharacterized protein FWK35_00006712 [Aphis craccivora]|uniref:Uncharacterized protein n=1 Tax=Aphis craccivora TaxID=307492 RepID=A0A6G0ZD69_APHCR|nr:Uncharacterized protein FWK35_00006712 [Aphis craccivora]